MKNIGLLGIGRMGQNHLRVLSMLKDVNLSFIYDTDETKAQKFSGQYGVRVSRDLDKDLQELDALVIATPTSTHYDFICNAVEHVDHIFVEKPLTDTLEKAEQIARLVKDKNKTIQIGFIERFNPAIIELEKVLAGSKKVLNTDFVRTNKISSRITDVDVIADLMIHDIDLALYLNGPYDSITSYGILEQNMIALARTTIKHKNGVYSNITASRITEKRIRQITVTCEDMYVDCNLDKKEIIINKQSELHKYGSVRLSGIEEVVIVPPQEALLNELLAFSSYTKEGSDTKRIPFLKAGVESLEVAEIIRSRIMTSG